MQHDTDRHTEPPPGLIYGLEDRPPLLVLLLLGLQHIFLMSSTLVLPVVLMTEIGSGFEQVRATVAMTMISCGIGTILQAVRWGVVGAGFLCPNLCGPNFFAASASAAWLGGLPLMRGMTIVAGLIEAVFARVIHRLQFLFPPEITGLVVFMVAQSLVPLASSKFLGIAYEGEPIQVTSLIIAAITLLLMVGLNIWGGSRFRLYSVLIGMAFGYSLSFLTGIESGSRFSSAMDAPWLALPAYPGMFELSFRWSLVPTFIIVSITGALKSFGNLILCEKVNDAAWKTPDIGRVGRGLLADAICVTVSGLLGGVASDTSASNVALSSASGATSRRIGLAAGAIFILLGFSPFISGILSIMPVPVMGAILVFVTCFMLRSGMQIIVGAGMDERRTFAIGVALIFGLSLDILPAMYVDLPGWLRPLFDSPLTLSTVLAVVLNQVLRIK